MKQQVFSISGANPDATLTSYLWERSDKLWGDKQWQPANRPAAIVCPGGAYRFLSDREAEPVAAQFYAAGFQTFILRYSLMDASAYPAPLEEASRAVWLIRSHAEEWGIDPGQILIGGFSAGGHAAALLGTRWNEEGLAARLGIPEGGNRPDGLFLCYPKLEPLPREAVLSDGGEVGHILRVYDRRADCVKNVGTHTPAAFLWHTRSDELVPFDESVRFASACGENGVPFELHVFAEGPHGLALDSDLTAYGIKKPVNVDRWLPMCIDWFKARFDF